MEKRDEVDVISKLKRDLSNKKNGRLTIPGKLLRAMKVSEENPSLRPEIGIYWVDDITFMVNNTTISKLFDIKPGTMNKHFSEFGFITLPNDITTSVATTPTENPVLGRDYDISVSSQWTKRRNERPNLFNKLVDPEMCILQKGVVYSEIVDSFLKDNPDKHEILAVLDKFKSIEWNSYADKCILEWKKLKERLNVSENEININVFSRFLASFYSNDGSSNLDQAIALIIPKSVCASHVTNKVKFLDYFRLCLRFGPPEAVVDNIKSLLKPNTSDFVDWFIPTVETTTIKSTGYVRFSSTDPCAFSLMKSNAESSDYIKFNPLADVDHRFLYEGIYYRTLNDVVMNIPNFISSVNMGMYNDPKYSAASSFQFGSYSNYQDNGYMDDYAPSF